MTEHPHQSLHNSDKPPKNQARFDNLSPANRALAQLSLKPSWAAYSMTAIAVVIAWIWLFFLAAGATSGSIDTPLGPGMSLWQNFLQRLEVSPNDNGLIAFIARICAPGAPGEISTATFLATFAMWLAMSLAMMLPSAMPMMRTYADIADVAAAKGEHAVPLLVLVAGYLSVWSLFALGISLLQLGFVALGVIINPVYPVQGIVGGMILIGAGLYQFSEMKNACLEKCRNPFSTLFGRWTNRPFGVFKLGVEQGIFCLGCCWALMLVMLVVGTMNLAWMAFFTLFAIAEKSGRGKVTSHVSGGILLIWGAVLSIVTALSI